MPLPTTPGARQWSADDLVWQRVPQPASVVQVTDGSLVQVPLVRSQVLVGTVQVTKPGLPQVERAAQRVTLPLQLIGTAGGF